MEANIDIMGHGRMDPPIAGTKKLDMQRTELSHSHSWSIAPSRIPKMVGLEKLLAP